ncbi:hypothetical protein D3C85_1027800 [compost metagenome]
MGNVEVAQLLQIRGAIHARRFQLLAVHRLQGRHEDQAGKRQPLPRDHHDDGKQGVSRQPVDGRGAKKNTDLCEQAVDRVEQHVLPHQGIHGRHDEERRNQEHAHDGAPRERFIDQQPQRRAQHHRDQHHGKQQDKRVLQGRQERGIGKEKVEIGQPMERMAARIEHGIAHERVVQGDQQRDHGNDGDGDHGRRQQSPGDNAFHSVLLGQGEPITRKAKVPGSDPQGPTPDLRRWGTQTMQQAYL